MAVHCTECGFLNGEAANYCQRCGASLAREEGSGEPVTATYRIDESGDLVPVEIDEVTAHGPALVIRAGGGRVGESFPVAGERMSIGRRPEAAMAAVRSLRRFAQRLAETLALAGTILSRVPRIAARSSGMAAEGWPITEKSQPSE